MSAEEVKWRKPVVPGDVLIIEVELTKIRGKIGKAKGVCKVAGEIVSEARSDLHAAGRLTRRIDDLRLKSLIINRKS